ncbi:MAG: hypothetical protein WD875_05435 [Pirellulales bacterium]
MPRIFRAMAVDGQLPLIGPSRDALGVVFGEPPTGDINIDNAGLVRARTGGMSVAPEWRKLPHHRIPKRLRAIFPRASGSNRYVCWSWGDGPFQDASLTNVLVLRIDSPNHGLVEPAADMSADDYQTAIAQTRSAWTIISEDDLK